MNNVGTPQKIHHTKQAPVLKRTVFEGKDFHCSLEFLQLQLSNRYKEQWQLRSLGQNLIKEFAKEKESKVGFLQLLGISLTGSNMSLTRA